MIYFKKVSINYGDKAGIEAVFRKWAIKRTNIVNLELSVMDIGTDKLFYGYENDKALYFTRIRSSFERFLPKIVFRIPKNEAYLFYEFRLGVVALMLFCLFCFGFIFDLVLIIQGTMPFENWISYFMFFLLFLSLAWLELKITSSKIKKAITK